MHWTGQQNLSCPVCVQVNPPHYPLRRHCPGYETAQRAWKESGGDIATLLQRGPESSSWVIVDVNAEIAGLTTILESLDSMEPEPNLEQHLIVSHGYHPDQLGCLTVEQWSELHAELHEGTLFLSTVLHVPQETIEAALRVGGYKVVKDEP